MWGLKKNFALLELLERLQRSNKAEMNINSYLNAETMEKEEQVTKCVTLYIDSF